MGTLPLLLLVVVCFIGCANTQVVKINRKVEVANGRVLKIRKEDLSFIALPGETCKVEVVTSEPMFQRTGFVTPTVFDCEYLPNTVRYEHNGSPFLDSDQIKFRAYRLQSNRTVSETFIFHIDITNLRCEYIRPGRMPITVPGFGAVSNPITKDVVMFHHGREFDSECFVKIDTTFKWNFPESGELVVEDNRGSGSDPSYKPLPYEDDTEWPCEEFLMKQIRYQHLHPPAPDIDFIPLKVSIKDGRSKTVVAVERHWFPVKINKAYPNEAPWVQNFGGVLEVDQFITTNILPTTLTAIDEETLDENLLFNITMPPLEGFITKLNDNCKSIQSFTQQDLKDLLIAYQPPNISYTERRSFEVEFVAIDSHCACSTPVRVLFSIRPSHTNAPRVSWNSGLTLLEGQARPLNKNCLQLVDSDNLDKVRITLSGGCQHGRLYKNGRIGYSFSWRDIEEGNVVYKHDDSDTTKDYVRFKMTDGSHSTRFKLPINILPKDDTPPVLVNNVMLELQEGEMILIHHFMLEAADRDSSADYILFNITRKPTAGKIMMQREHSNAPWEINSFQQRDLFQGLIYYKHSGDEIFEDSFDFVMEDSCRPTPNVSPVQTMNIHVTPLYDIPPKPVDGITRALTSEETDVIYLDATMLEYFDEEDKEADLIITVTTPCFRLINEEDETSISRMTRDAGKLFVVEDVSMLTKDANILPIYTFTQNALNHQQIAYMPPLEDIGPVPIDVQFVYSVTDGHGQRIEGERFSITILPVDNIVPKLTTGLVEVYEGEAYSLTKNQLNVSDEDTFLTDITFIVSQIPTHGNLLRYTKTLNVEDAFTVEDITKQKIKYTHDGSENHEDSFSIIASDGHQKSDRGVVSIQVLPVDDQDPVFKESLTQLSVNEDSSAILTLENIQASDVDSNDGQLLFEIVSQPRRGYITKDGLVVNRFKQQDIIDKRIAYKHNSLEIGLNTVTDVVTFTVSDRQLRQGQDEFDGFVSDEMQTTYDLRINVHPVNNQPPRLVVGSVVFACDEAKRQQLTTEHLMASDQDSTEESLEFIILQPPKFGQIEDATPTPGSEVQSNKVVDRFKLTTLEGGYIIYNQSIHEGVEPTSDMFTVAATDGKFTSAEIPFLISINPTNDEAPIISARNFSCREGGMKKFSSSLFSVTDKDVPANEVMVTVVEFPLHGKFVDGNLMERKNMSLENIDPIQDFSTHVLNANEILPIYIHDGGESDQDRFVLKISDGKHRKIVPFTINIQPINDEQPSVTRNRGISLELGDSKIISNIALESFDADSSPEELIFNLHSLPKRGMLQFNNGTASEWRDVTLTDKFTQYDINENRIRYKHNNVLGSKGRDSFRFSVTDGKFVTNRENFAIEIKYSERSIVHVATNLVRVKEGGKVFITTDYLSARDGSNQAADISYEVTTPPRYGNIEYANFPDVATDMFSQLDIVGRQIVYSHKSKEDTASDFFTVMATNHVRSTEATIQIQIQPVDDVIPTLVMSPDATGTHLSLFQSSSATITDSLILIADPDSPTENLHILITQLPEHGDLFISDVVLDRDVPYRVDFTELQNGVLSYRHNGDGASFDRIKFIVSDGVHSTYFMNGFVQHEPAVLNIGIDRIDETPPDLTVNRPAEKIQKGDDYAIAITIDSHNLLSTDAGTDNADEITYSITQDTAYGVLELQSSAKGERIEEFTQNNLNQRELSYVVSRKLNVTNDSFTFDVFDSWGNVLINQRFEIRWSRLGFVEKLVKVCESDELWSIRINRHGNLNMSAFASISVKGITADINKDIVYNNAEQIQLDPGVLSTVWQFKAPDDGMEERREKLRVVLHSSVNTVLDPILGGVTIYILDAGHKRCLSNAAAPTVQIQQPTVSRRKNLQRKNDIDRPQNLPSPSDGTGRVKYGKLGPGVTVKPASFYKDKSQKVWTYHGLVPITIDEADEHELTQSQPLVPQHDAVPQNKPVSTSPVAEEIINEELLNDSPSGNQNLNLYDGRIKVENSNMTAQVSVTRKKQKLRKIKKPKKPKAKPTLSKPKFPRMCNLAMSDRLYYDTTSKVLYRCDGAQWQPWSPSKITNNKLQKSNNAKCADGWKLYKDRCYIFKNAKALSWNSAQRLCMEEHNAHLVTIQSEKHLKWLRKLTKKKPFWTGLNRKFDHETWEWSNRDEVEYTNWKRGHPKRGKQNSSKKMDCALVLKKKRWISKECDRDLSGIGFICMRDSI